MLPLGPRAWLGAGRRWINLRLSRFTVGGSLLNDVNRMAANRGKLSFKPSPGQCTDLPDIDISLVTFNSGECIGSFLASLIAQKYPLDKIHLYFVDHGSGDQTLPIIAGFAAEHAGSFAGITRLQQANRGFGAGHNVTLREGRSKFVLVSNVDLEFEPDAILQVVTKACADEPQVASWELRQKPYEHPKYYDPVSGETAWSSHACCLLRRTAVQDAGGYDESIFMYCEDVDLSYRLRAAGQHLRYVPTAVVWHHSYAEPGETKPLQYLGAIYGNLLIRLRHGGLPSRLGALPVALAFLLRSPPAGVSRMDVLRKIFEVPAHAWLRMFAVRATPSFGVRRNRYSVERSGAWLPLKPMPARQPLVSIIIRTYAGRETLLVQAVASCLQQTWSNIEILLVEDGETRQPFERIAALDSRIRFLASPGGGGRTPAGNFGLAAAAGEYLTFLDDDDLLFHDHIETLMTAILDKGATLAFAETLETPMSSRGARPCPHDTVVTMLPVRILSREQALAQLKLRNPFPIQSVLFSRALYDSHGGFNESLEWLEDWDLWKRYFKTASPISIPKTTSLFRTPARFRGLLERQWQFGRHFSIARQIAADSSARQPAVPG